MTKLKDDLGPKGLNVISITNESREIVLKFLTQLNAAKVTYTIGLGGGSGNYPSKYIPAAWLIGVDGKVVWAGGPGGLSDKILEAELKKVKLTDAQKGANAEKALAYAESLVSAKEVLRGVGVLEGIVKDYKGSEAAKKAEERKAAIEKDEALKKELAAQKDLERMVGGLDLPKEKLKGKERELNVVKIEGFIKKHKDDAPGTVQIASMWQKVMQEDWKAVK